VKLRNTKLNKSWLAATSFLLPLSAQADFVAPKVAQAPIIDGQMDSSWRQAKWYPIDQPIIGGLPTAEDFSGRFKLLWDQQHIYLMAEIADDVLFDQHADPLHFYWDDDCLEIFIDEDASGGEHQFNYNAFAYHVALDNQGVDIGENYADGSVNFLTLNDHIDSVWRRQPGGENKLLWEVAIKVFDDSFKPNTNSKPVTLNRGKELGFMLAYCDNDGSKNREHFIGSTFIKGENGDKNLGYKTASVFDRLVLK